MSINHEALNQLKNFTTKLSRELKNGDVEASFTAIGNLLLKANELDASITHEYIVQTRNKKNGDPIIYKFRHTSGTIFIGTRKEFIKKFDLSSKCATWLIKGHRKSAWGWFFFGEKNGSALTDPSQKK
jgi:hypothetical protein